MKHKITMSGLLALCGLALQHVAELGSNFTGDHLIAGALMLTCSRPSVSTVPFVAIPVHLATRPVTSKWGERGTERSGGARCSSELNIVLPVGATQCLPTC